MQERYQHYCADCATLCIVAVVTVADSFATAVAPGASFVVRFGSAACFWAGALCALSSAYFFLIAPIEDVVLAIVLFGGAVGLELVAALLKRGRGD